MKVLAFDPGKENFAWAFIRDRKCKQHGFIRTVTTLHSDHVQDELRRCTSDIAALLDKYDPDFVGFERMQHRPKFGGGAVSEYINIMIGLLLNECLRRKIKMLPFAAVTWKTHVRKLFNAPKNEFTMVTQKMTFKAPPGTMRKLKGKMVPVKTQVREVAGVLASQPGHAGLTPHEGDAIGIGCYVWYKVSGINIVEAVLT